MKKKRLLRALGYSGGYNELWINMRRSVFLSLGLVLFVSASSYSQTKRVKLNLKSVSASKLFEEIRKQTNYSFFVNEANVGKIKSITLDKSNVTVKEVLQEVLANTNLTFTLVGDTIIIKNEETKVEPKKQQRNVTGKVIDANTGESLPGVTVVSKGFVRGEMTNPNGEFSITVSETADALVFSYVGYEKQEVRLNDQTDLTVRMMQDVEQLKDVVVTGYQIIDKRESTSAISSIEKKDMNIVNALTVDQMLEGKAAGLMVSNLSTTPGAAAKIRIRAGSTFTGNQSPLWVIDGVIYEDPVPLTADQINSFDNVNIIGNALTGINPDDIAKIDILKDASATAIYGTRAASGVIVITTKRGKEGKPVLSYSTGFSFVQPPAYSDFNLMNSKERIDVSREMYERNLGFTANYANVDRLGYEGALMNLWDGTFTSQQFQDKVSFLETLNTDWFGKLYRASVLKKHSLNASGGSKNARYYFSLGYDDQQGTERGVDLNRITALSNIDLDIRENVLLSFKFSGSVQNAKYNHSSINPFNEAYYTSRTIPIYDDNGEYFYQSKEIFRGLGAIKYGRYNILREMDNSERNVNNKDFNISAQLRWKFLDNFRFTSLASYRNTTNLNEQWITEDTYYVAKLRTYDKFEELVQDQVNGYATVPFGGVYNGGMVSQTNYLLRNQLNYSKSLTGGHVFNINLGQEVNSTKYWGAQGFTVPGYNHSQGRSFIEIPVSGYENMITWLSTDGSNSVYPSITDKIQNSLSMFGIFNYVYDNRYVANFNVRSDGSNAFGQYQRYKFKPTWSASARWNIHNESFLSENNVFDELALRASYGIRGTMPNSNPYLIISNYGRNDVMYYPETTANLQTFPNANLRWEKTNTLNLGLNYSIFGGRISGALDYAYSKSTDLLISRPVSLVNGTGIQSYNAGSKDVSSFEFGIRTVNIKLEKFAWNTSFNFSHDVDRVLKGFEEGVSQSLTVNNYLSGNIYRSGFPTSGFFSYQFDGLNDKGLPTFKNLDMPNASREDHLKAALVYEGTRSPKFYGGFGSEFKYGNFSLSASFSYKLGYKTRLLSLYNGNQNLPLPYENMNSAFNDRWRQPGDEAFTNIPALTNYDMRFVGSAGADGLNSVYVSNMGWTVPNGKNAWWMYDNSDARVVNGDHIRFQSVTLSYSVPSKVLAKAAVKSLTLGLQGSNLHAWAFDKKLNGQDPEQVSSLGMPSLATYSFSLNMSF